MQEIKSKVHSIVSDALGIPTQNVTETSTWDGLGADSLDVLDVIQKCEDEFGIAIPEEAWHPMETINELAVYIFNTKQ
ncbi:MAG: acyl carrier protein [Taibaiella sp.]|jgi:acyl carrier protein